MSLRALLLLFVFATPLLSQAAALSLGPPAGTFTVGSTFDVAVTLDSGGEVVNAVRASLQFPPDRLQLVSPTVGKSIVGVWVTAPEFNNQTGQIHLEGVIPGGLKTSNGLLTTLTFRVKSVGQAVLKFAADSSVLLNDGVGTDALKQIQSGIYQLVLPPPAGPLVSSETHPDQTHWSTNENAVLVWATENGEAQGYSYLLSDQPIDLPDDISEGARTGVSYRSLSEGRHYFHIKALRSGVWGETTHFALLIDATPPAEFPVEILPAERTTNRRPVIQFTTTDSSSGLDHYELQLVPLQPAAGAGPAGPETFFIEATSPYVPTALEPGEYDVIIRAYDQAGNMREVIRRLAVVMPVFRFISDQGLIVGERVIISWPWFWAVGLLLLLGLGYLSIRLRLVHFHLHRRHEDKNLPLHVQDQLNELQQYRQKYGKVVLVLLTIGSLLGARLTVAQTAPGEPLAPPVVTTISRQISNQEIFYLGGRSDTANSEVVIYLQNPATGELTSLSTPTDNSGDWFYRHDHFLPAGGYLLWTQARRGVELSPPGPQLGLTVAERALQFGASRLSYEAIYLLIILVLAGGLIILLFDIWFQHRKIKHKRHLLREEIREAEESLRRGFAILRRDIETELATAREHHTREHLLADLAKVEKYVGKELWDVAQVEYNKEQSEK